MPKLISLRDLFKNTWDLYREKFVLLVGLLVGPFVLMAIGQIITFFRPGGLLILLSQGLFLLSGAWALWGGAALILVLHQRQEPFTLKEAYRLAWNRKLLSLIWVAILTGFVVGGAFMLLIVPGLILMVWFLFSQLIVLLEGEKGFKALIKSREYGRNYFWAILGRYLALLIAFLLVFLVLGLIFSLVSKVFGLGAVNTEKVIMFFSLISVLFNILITPLALVYIYLLYENLKSVKGEISIDPAKRQAIWYLVIGFAGWLFMFLIWGILFSFLLTLLMGMFVGQALTGLDNPKLNLPTEALPFAPQAVTPAGLSAEQKKQLETQMETMKKLQDQLTKFKATLPDETLDQ